VPVVTADALVDQVSAVLERLVAIGDLVETIEERGGVRRTVLYLGGPRFVMRANGDAIVLGVRPDGLPIVSEELLDEVVERGHIRRVRSRPDLAGLLEAEGLREVQSSRWLRAPEAETAVELAAAYDVRVGAAPTSGEIGGLRILDTSTANTYYWGRWREPGPEHTGNFIARRGRRFGADLWAYVALDRGRPLRLLDFPALSPDRGCDEAWRLQAALDAAAGDPQAILVQGTG
jgi:hypothetical protein